MDTIMPGIICKRINVTDGGDEEFTHVPLIEVRFGLIFTYDLVPFEYISVMCPCGQFHELAPFVLVEEAKALGTFTVISRGAYPDPMMQLDYEIDSGIWFAAEATWPLPPHDEAVVAAEKVGMDAGLLAILERGQLDTAGEAEVRLFRELLAGMRRVVQYLPSGSHTPGPDDDFGETAA